MKPHKNNNKQHANKISKATKREPILFLVLMSHHRITKSIEQNERNERQERQMTTAK